MISNTPAVKVTAWMIRLMLVCIIGVLSYIFPGWALGFALLGIAVFVHELGHFLVAKWRGLSVSRFWVGFGPPLFSFSFRGVRYGLSVFLFGGFVDIMGMHNDEEKNRKIAKKLRKNPLPEDASFWQRVRAELSPAPYTEAELTALNDESKWFSNKKPIDRFLVAFAGPLFSILLGPAFLMTYFYLQGEQVVIRNPITVQNVLVDGAADKAGLKDGDVITAVNGEKASDFIDLHMKLMMEDMKDAPVYLTVNRNGEEIRVPVDPSVGEKELRQLDCGYAYDVVEIDSVYTAAVVSLTQGTDYLKQNSKSLADFSQGKLPVTAMSGPIGMLEIANKLMEMHGVVYLLNFFAIITIALGITNLLPIPCLDGGHMSFATIERIGQVFMGTEWRIPHSIKGRLEYAGAFVLIGLIALVTLVDIGVYQRIVSFFS